MKIIRRIRNLFRRKGLTVIVDGGRITFAGRGVIDTLICKSGSIGIIEANPLSFEVLPPEMVVPISNATRPG